MALTRTGKNPLAYLGVDPRVAAPDVFNNRAPGPNDRLNFTLGTRWLDLSVPNNSILWFLASVAGGVATWISLGAQTTTIVGEHGINVSAVPGTATVAMDNAIVLGDLSNSLGFDTLTLTTGDLSLSAGNIYLTNIDATYGRITVDAGARFFWIPGIGNTMIGKLAGAAAMSGVDNTGLGETVLLNITTGSNNTAIGWRAGANYTTESNNIVIGNSGTASDSGAIRLGTQGAGSGQQNKARIAATWAVTPPGGCGVVTLNGSSQLGGTNVGSNTDILTSGGVGTAPSFQPRNSPAGGCAFFAYLTFQFNGSTTVNNPIVFDGVLFDIGSDYDATTSTFTAPADGTYMFSSVVTYEVRQSPFGPNGASLVQMYFSVPALSGAGSTLIRFNRTHAPQPALEQPGQFPGVPYVLNASGTAYIEMTTGQTVQIVGSFLSNTSGIPDNGTPKCIGLGASTGGYQYFTTFSGMRIT
jgi:hypothetical protein